MTKQEIEHKYLEWAASHMIYAKPDDMSNSAVSIYEYDDKSTDDTLTGAMAFAISKVRSEKLYIFVYAHKTTWQCDEAGDIIPDKIIDEQYEIVSAT